MTSAVSDWEIGRREGELPEGWAVATLEEIVVHVLGGEWGEGPEAAETDPELVRVCVVRGTEFRDWHRARGATAAPRAIKRTSLAKRRLAVGDLVVEISGGGAGQPVGRTLLIDEESLARAGAPLVCSNFCRQMRIHPEVDPGYVQLALNHLYLAGAFDEHQTQTTNIRNLNFKSFLSGVILPLPPLAEQARIVAKARELLAPVQRALEYLAALPEILRRLRHSVLAAAYAGRLTEDWRALQPDLDRLDRLDRFDGLESRLKRAFARRHQQYDRACRDAEAYDRRAPRRPKNLASTPWQAPAPLEPPEVPEGWCLVALHDVIHRAQYGLSVKADRDAKNGIAMLRMSNIQEGRIDAGDLKYVGLKAADAEAYRVRRGDLLFNRTNSPELVGKAAVYDLDLAAVFASYLVRIQCDESLISPRYACGWITSPWGRRWARTVRTDCVSQSNINVSRLLTLPVPMPSLAEQHEIVRRIDEIFAFAAEVEEQVTVADERAHKLWRTILVRALRGELVPTEAELARGEGRGFEPAADVLDRIGAERRLGPEGEALSAEEAVSDPILAAVRQACWGAGALPREALIERVAMRLACPKPGKSVRARLERHLEIALARRIVAREGELLAGATPTFGRYDYGFLVHTAQTLLQRSGALDQGDLVRALAAHLGYSQVTFAIRVRMERVFQWAVQNGMLEVREGRIYFSHSNSS